MLNDSEPPPRIIQAIWDPLNGEIQTTPRAELEAIPQLLEHAYPPICVVTDHTNHVLALVHLGEGRFASGSEDTTIKVWDAEGKCEKTLKGHSYGELTQTQFSEQETGKPQRDRSRILVAR